MRYDWNERIAAAPDTMEFFAEIDRRHFLDAARYTPPKSRPLDRLIPYDALHNLDVLEIGVGNGSHAQLIAPLTKSYVGIDLTDYAVARTRKRFELFGIPGRIVQMDAEQLEFPDSSFDFIWSWGVIHHSSDTGRIVREMSRVLRPGGRATVMVYHRSFFYYYVFCGLCRGVLRGGLVTTKSLHNLVQQSTDGAIARFYSVPEWRKLVAGSFQIDRVEIKGQKSELFPLPAGRLKAAVMKAAPNAVTRMFLNTMRQGSFLISQLTKL